MMIGFVRPTFVTHPTTKVSTLQIMKQKIDELIEQRLLEHANRRTVSGWRILAHLWLFLTQRKRAVAALRGIVREFC